MTPMNIAGRDRSEKDALVKIPTATLILEGLITEKEGCYPRAINHRDVPKILGFQDEALVEQLNKRLPF